MTSSNFLAGLAFGGAAIIMGIGLLSLGESLGVKEPKQEISVQQSDVSRKKPKFYQMPRRFSKKSSLLKRLLLENLQ